MALVRNPGVSIVGVDPGGTTGVAVWDAWDQLWYYAQLDAGTGRRIKTWLSAGRVESPEFVAVGRRLGLFDGKGNPRLKAKNDPRIVNMVEYQCAEVLMEIMHAVGPSAIVVLEDFVLGWGDPGNVGSAGREGLAPVRMLSKIDTMMERDGLKNGDAWRRWRGFGAASKDNRGVIIPRQVAETGGILTLPERIESFRRYKEDGDELDSDQLVGALWRGGGQHVVMSMPARKKAVGDAELVRLGMWWPGHRHAMDAMLHATDVTRKLGSEIGGEWKQLWPNTQKRLSARK